MALQAEDLPTAIATTKARLAEQKLRKQLVPLVADYERLLSAGPRQEKPQTARGWRSVLPRLPSETDRIFAHSKHLNAEEVRRTEKAVARLLELPSVHPSDLPDLKKRVAGGPERINEAIVAVTRELRGYQEAYVNLVRGNCRPEEAAKLPEGTDIDGTYELLIQSHAWRTVAERIPPASRVVAVDTVSVTPTPFVEGIGC